MSIPNGQEQRNATFGLLLKKIHEDIAITAEDKFQYLLQAFVEDSRAHELVSGFPPTGENYPKVIKSLKNCFDRDDVVI